MTRTNYTMEQLSSFLYDALNEEDLSAQQIYESIIETVAEQTEYLQLQYEKSQQLFDLLKGTVKPYEAPWNKFIEDNKDGFLSKERESNFPKEDKPKTWILPVDDEGVITCVIADMIAKLDQLIQTDKLLDKVEGMMKKYKEGENPYEQ
jgi:type III secretory pathway component EscR